MMTHALRILLVEDNPGDARLLEDMLAADPPDCYQLTHVLCLGEALNHLAKGGVDIILLDLGLPDGEGLENVRKVRDLAPHVPLMVLTGWTDEAIVTGSMLEGAQDYLIKGQVENRTLARAMRQAIERSSLLTKAASTNVELQERIREKDILLSEIHHRVKNSLQVVSSLLSLESNLIQDPIVVERLRNTQNRVRAMAFIHQTLYQSKDFARVDFRSFLQSFAPTLVQSFSIHPERITLHVEVDEVALPIDGAIPCALIVNELISNALEHAFPGGRSGSVSVFFRQGRDNLATLRVEDDGIGLPAGFDFEQSKTLGIQLVHLLAGQLGGGVHFDQAGPTRFVVTVPLKGRESKMGAGEIGVNVPELAPLSGFESMSSHGSA